MSWTQVLANWPHLQTQLSRDFNQLDLAALRRFRGDRDKMEVYLAESHDLTINEANEVLEEWLVYRGAKLPPAQAA